MQTKRTNVRRVVVGSGVKINRTPVAAPAAKRDFNFATPSQANHIRQQFIDAGIIKPVAALAA